MKQPRVLAGGEVRFCAGTKWERKPGVMRLLAGVALTVVLWIASLVGLAALTLATGGSFTECDRGDCGALGEFAMDATWPLVPVVLFAAAGVVTWLVLRRRSS